MSANRLLIVEPDHGLRSRLSDVARALASIHATADFPAARRALLQHRYDWVITNVHLGAFNGLHLAYLVNSNRPPLRVILYGDNDLALALEAQRVGAFYESRDCVDRTIAAYLQGTLPPTDRRHPLARDRRGAARGGRRCVDRPFVAG
jgi:DNA-binding NtrC family response regulator